MNHTALAGYLLNYFNVFLFFTIPLKLFGDESGGLSSGERIVITIKDNLPFTLPRSSWRRLHPEWNFFTLDSVVPDLTATISVQKDVHPHTILVFSVSGADSGQWYVTIRNNLGFSYTSRNYSENISVSVSELLPGADYSITLHHVSGTERIYGYYNMKLM